MKTLYDRAIAFVFVIGLVLGAVLALAGPASAASFEESLAGFGTDEYADTEAAIVAVATSGNVLAATVIEALQDGRLLFDPDTKKVYIKETSGRILDAATGKPI